MGRGLKRQLSVRERVTTRRDRLVAETTHAMQGVARDAKRVDVGRLSLPQVNAYFKRIEEIERSMAHFGNATVEQIRRPIRPFRRALGHRRLALEFRTELSKTRTMREANAIMQKVNATELPGREKRELQRQAQARHS
jgi:hypothetical protein